MDRFNFLFIVQKLLSENFFIQRFISLVLRTITEFYNIKISFAIKHTLLHYKSNLINKKIINKYKICIISFHTYE